MLDERAAELLPYQLWSSESPPLLQHLLSLLLSLLPHLPLSPSADWVFGIKICENGGGAASGCRFTHYLLFQSSIILLFTTWVFFWPSIVDFKYLLRSEKHHYNIVCSNGNRPKISQTGKDDLNHYIWR